MQYFLNYKAINKDLLEPHLQETRGFYTKPNKDGRKKVERDGRGACIYNARDRFVKQRGGQHRSKRLL